ncbi:MAG TPA: phosphoribosyltransferase family protein [Caulobacteraceae bacterium]|jgi:hypoxanthine phosphoribosyltransferase|nr:phosphoribosyltransferase family protein [Caulobacteraceae bacterium]
MAEAAAAVEVVLTADAIAAAVESLADRLVLRLAPDAIGVCLLIGGLWFAADLTRALAVRGRPVGFDGLWLASYGDARQSSGACELRAGLQRPVAGRQVLIIDDVIDSGASLVEASRLMIEAGAAEVLTAVFARKPWPGPRPEPDFIAWEAPPRFLVGYGMDLAGALRGLPYVGAVSA